MYENFFSLIHSPFGSRTFLSGNSKNSGNIGLLEKSNKTFIFLSYHFPYISIGLKENSGNSIVSHENIEKCAWRMKMEIKRENKRKYDICKIIPFYPFVVFYIHFDMQIVKKKSFLFTFGS